MVVLARPQLDGSFDVTERRLPKIGCREWSTSVDRSSVEGTSVDGRTSSRLSLSRLQERSVSTCAHLRSFGDWGRPVTHVATVRVIGVASERRRVTDANRPKAVITGKRRTT
jgi:hypothetical protein